MLDVNSLLKEKGLSYNELRPDEREALMSMTKALQAEVVDVEKIQDHLEDLIDHVTEELTKIGDETWNLIYIWRRKRWYMARLKNLKELHKLFKKPERMEKAMREHLENSLNSETTGGGGII